jgi:iron-sulfur cluster assembly accessory protein
MSNEELSVMMHPVLTENAARRIQNVMSSEVKGSMLRIGVDGGGCSGFQYVFSIDNIQNADDILITHNGATVVIDEMSLSYLEGAVIDFVDDMMGQAFRINNPQAKSSCGCGVSFSL